MSERLKFPVYEEITYDIVGKTMLEAAEYFTKRAAEVGNLTIEYGSDSRDDNDELRIATSYREEDDFAYKRRLYLEAKQAEQKLAEDQRKKFIAEGIKRELAANPNAKIYVRP